MVQSKFNGLLKLSVFFIVMILSITVLNGCKGEQYDSEASYLTSFSELDSVSNVNYVNQIGFEKKAGNNLRQVYDVKFETDITEPFVAVFKKEEGNNVADYFVPMNYGKGHMYKEVSANDNLEIEISKLRPSGYINCRVLDIASIEEKNLLKTNVVKTEKNACYEVSIDFGCDLTGILVYELAKKDGSELYLDDEMLYCAEDIISWAYVKNGRARITCDKVALNDIDDLVLNKLYFCNTEIVNNQEEICIEVENHSGVITGPYWGTVELDMDNVEDSIVLFQMNCKGSTENGEVVYSELEDINQVYLSLGKGKTRVTINNVNISSYVGNDLKGVAHIKGEIAIHSFSST